MKHLTFLFACLLALTGLRAQTYDYRTEDFEGEEWAVAGATVTSARGQWTTNKNVHDSSQVWAGQWSLHFSGKAGLTSPELTEGVGAIVYYAYDQNRQVYVETSLDGNSWQNVESYKETSDWTRHVVSVFDADVRYVRISTTSNKNFYIDNLLITKPDGTDADGNRLVTDLLLPYFTQTFENTGTYPQSSSEAASEASYSVEGQGEWKYLNAYKGTNEAYIPDGSGHSLRMLKSTSYVISPLLSQGVVQLSFDEGRTGRDLVLYTSTDGGTCWTKTKAVDTQKQNTVVLQDRSINRIKIANEGSSDADLDNLCITAFPEGTPATVTSGEASQTTASTARVSGRISDPGSQTILEKGFCWSLSDTPTLADQIVSAAGEDETGTFSALLEGLPANTAVYYRAYALSLAGIGYGEAKSLQTLPATAPTVSTRAIVYDEERSDEQYIYVCTGGDITDTGGDAVTQCGVCYGEQANPTVDGPAVRGYATDGSFRVYIPLRPNTTWHFRAYAVNNEGTSYGEDLTYTAGAIVVPTYAHHVYYVSPNGSDQGDGSAANPFYHLDKVVTMVNPGDTIYMLAGTYSYDSRVNIQRHGKKDSGRISLFAKGGRAVLDYSAMAYADANQGMRITASYWHLYGLDIVGCGDNGILIERNKPSGGNYASIKDSTSQAHDNIIENCSFCRCGDTGLQIKNLGMNNRIVNCDSYFNRDDSDGDADGYAVKLSHGDGNYFYGCRAWNNSDDGWDGFIRQDGGFPDDITTTLENCWAFRNGFLEDGSEGKGNGNGFKMGSDEGRNNMIFNRCLAFENLQKNFDQNHNTGHMILNNCTSYSAKYTANKSHYTYRIDEPLASGRRAVLHNSVAISDGIADRTKSDYAPYSLGDFVEFVSSDLNTLPADWQSIDASEATAARAADGTLPQMAFMHIADGNAKLIDQGTEVAPFEGESRFSQGISWNGAAPDLGCFETGDAPTALQPIAVSESTESGLRLTRLRGGSVLIELEGWPAGNTACTVYAYGLSGRCLACKTFCGTATVLETTAAEGCAVVCIEGNGFRAAAKVVLP